MPESPRPRRFDLIAFDWDGTLFDSTAIIVRSIQDAVRDVGGAVPSDAAAAWVRRVDPSRPIHYEGGFSGDLSAANPASHTGRYLQPVLARR